jgi:hypothetical protein
MKTTKRDRNGLLIPYKKASSFEFKYFPPFSNGDSKHKDHGFDTALKAKREAMRVLKIYKSGSVRIAARFSDNESEHIGEWYATPTACFVRMVKR